MFAVSDEELGSIFVSAAIRHRQDSPFVMPKTFVYFVNKWLTIN